MLRAKAAAPTGARLASAATAVSPRSASRRLNRARIMSPIVGAGSAFGHSPSLAWWAVAISGRETMSRSLAAHRPAAQAGVGYLHPACEGFEYGRLIFCHRETNRKAAWPIFAICI